MRFLPQHIISRTRRVHIIRRVERGGAAGVYAHALCSYLAHTASRHFYALDMIDSKCLLQGRKRERMCKYAYRTVIYILYWSISISARAKLASTLGLLDWAE